MFNHGSILNGHVLPFLDMIIICQNMFKHVNEHGDTCLNMFKPFEYSWRSHVSCKYVPQHDLQLLTGVFNSLKMSKNHWAPSQTLLRTVNSKLHAEFSNCCFVSLKLVLFKRKIRVIFPFPMSVWFVSFLGDKYSKTDCKTFQVWHSV